MGWEGLLVGIWLAARAGEALIACEEALLDEHGIIGDRYHAGQGTFSSGEPAGRAVTLIEHETLEALANEAGILLPAGAYRRNLVTIEVPLNHLVGRTFQVGEVVLEGVRLAEPCSYLEWCTRPGVRRALLHRGGLRANVLRGGKVRLGDLVRAGGGRAAQ
ncbi:MAG: molybdenum cofactor biosynthesis protein [Dehalococcoidia bacterium]|nr:MAG: molybdenum cofactor biosynthesis protein [Dehalococcoidia bacterium]